ncbi:hypothetical protein ACIRO3_34580 [Streptomyces sp. NPDC102278]|uniref:hypothetical protein n=1 Tax=Streptomyces sp. NPDC102278 TaxID=3366152 RepID=UPI0038146995
MRTCTRPSSTGAAALGVRAALVSTSAGTAAERLTAALGGLLPPLRPAVTARMIGDLTRAGVLLRLKGPADAPVVHVDRSRP